MGAARSNSRTEKPTHPRAMEAAKRAQPAPALALQGGDAERQASYFCREGRQVGHESGRVDQEAGGGQH